MFLDVVKAFDSVFMPVLYKLHLVTMLLAMVQHINSFLDARTFRTHTLSAEHPISAEVPQGSALSPLLYAIFTADIAKPPRSSPAINRTSLAMDSTM